MASTKEGDSDKLNCCKLAETCYNNSVKWGNLLGWAKRILFLCLELSSCIEGQGPNQKVGAHFSYLPGGRHVLKATGYLGSPTVSAFVATYPQNTFLIMEGPP